VVGDLGRAIVGHVQDHDLAFRRGDTIEIVVADTHAADRPQPGKTLQVVGIDLVAQDHQALCYGAVVV
jgi:hypothetical protein